MLVVDNFIDESEINQTIKKIFQLKSDWNIRTNHFVEIPFYSLGAAVYLDVFENDLENYSQLYKRKNPILNENFSDLHQKIYQCLKGIYNCDFIHYEKSALPGFHIFLTDDVFEIPIASRHCDLQYLKIDWCDLTVDPSKALSFTLYLKLPANGGGVYYWDRFHEELTNYDAIKREQILHDSTRHLKTFSEGDLFIHNGHQFHQIAPFFDIQENDQRISLQGHAIYSPTINKYLVHW